MVAVLQTDFILNALVLKPNDSFERTKSLMLNYTASIFQTVQIMMTLLF